MLRNAKSNHSWRQHWEELGSLYCETIRAGTYLPRQWQKKRICVLKDGLVLLLLFCGNRRKRIPWDLCLSNICSKSELFLQIFLLSVSIDSLKMLSSSSLNIHKLRSFLLTVLTYNLFVFVSQRYIWSEAKANLPLNKKKKKILTESTFILLKVEYRECDVKKYKTEEVVNKTTTKKQASDFVV